MEGLKQALELIQHTATRAEKAVVHDLGDPRAAYVQQGNTWNKIDLPADVRNHHVNTLDDLMKYVEEKSEAAVWHGVDGVVAILDDSDRRDRVTFSLSFSDRFRRLRELAKEKPSFQQAQFVKLLRIELGLDNTAVVSKFRKLDWESGDKSRGTIQHGDSRLSKEVIAKVDGIDQLPDTLPVPCPVYQQSGERQEYIVQCAVEIDAVNRTFQLLPLSDEIERVIDLAQSSIRERLDANLSLSSIYFGAP